MNHRQHHFVPLSIAALAALACAPSFASYKCDAPASLVDAKACAAAAQGPQALRRFVQRTQPMWGTYYFDYVKDDDAAIARAAKEAEGAPVGRTEPAATTALR